MAAIDNAEAPDVTTGPDAVDGVIAGGVLGLGAGEVARLRLTAADVEFLTKLTRGGRRPMSTSAFRRTNTQQFSGRRLTRSSKFYPPFRRRTAALVAPRISMKKVIGVVDVRRPERRRVCARVRR